MALKKGIATVVVALATLWTPAAAQPVPPGAEAAVRALRDEGMIRSRVMDLAQVLLDSIGPRLTGSPGSEAASDWILRTYRSWGIEGRTERYGTWIGWRRGPSHLDLIAPRVRTLASTMLAWSPGTRGPLTGPVLTLPLLRDAADRQAFFARARGAFVLISPLQPTCRPDDSWERWATPEAFARLKATRDSTIAAWRASARSFGAANMDALATALEDGGVAGVISSEWSQGWGTDRIFDASPGARTPQLDVECEDYGLLWRLSERGQGPVVRLEAEASPLGEVPVANTLATIPGGEQRDQYVLLSAHLDSWDGASGATDNGTGTVVMMEAMRILRAVLPHPRRTIMAGHWNGEEQGLIGSRAFAADHPEILAGLQASFNQDDGTGRADRITMEGLVGPGSYFEEWLARMPPDLTEGVGLADPGTPGRGGTDNASFICWGAPAFGVNSKGWDYSRYTWHTTRDTFDKLVPEDLRRNATLIAMLAWFASETPDRLPREKAALLPDPRTGENVDWPTCTTPRRSSGR